jgi:hypothetical protein
MILSLSSMRVRMELVGPEARARRRLTDAKSSRRHFTWLARVALARSRGAAGKRGQSTFVCSFDPFEHA